MKAISLCLLLAIIALVFAQSEDARVNEMSKFVINALTDNAKPPEGWRVGFIDRKGHDNSKVFINDAKKRVVMAYGGTEFNNLKDWGTDLDAKKQNLNINGVNYGKVHEGFLKQFKTSEAGMFGAAMPLVQQGYKLDITGHSQGGAVATIASAVAAEKYGAQPRVTTMGSPRTGDATFAKQYDSRVTDNLRAVDTYTVRGTSRTEMVPNTPFRVMGFEHVGKQYNVYTGTGDFTNKITNHFIQNYERATNPNAAKDTRGLISIKASQVENAVGDKMKGGYRAAMDRLTSIVSKGRKDGAASRAQQPSTVAKSPVSSPASFPTLGKPFSGRPFFTGYDIPSQVRASQVRASQGIPAAMPSQGRSSQGRPSQSRPAAMPSQGRPSQSKPSFSRPSQPRPSQSRPSQGVSQGRPSQPRPSMGVPSVSYSRPSVPSVSYSRPSAPSISHSRPSAQSVSYSRPSAPSVSYRPSGGGSARA